MTFDEAFIDAISQLGWEEFQPGWWKRVACLQRCCWQCVSVDEIHERFGHFEQTHEPYDIGVRVLHNSHVRATSYTTIGQFYCWRVWPGELPEDDEARAVALAFLCDQLGDKPE